MENKKQINEEQSLAYKEHTEFFRKFFEIRQDFFEAWSKAYFDKEQAQIAFQKMLIVVNWTLSQTRDNVTTTDIKSTRNKIIGLIATNKIIPALDLMEEFISQISEYQQASEILPKVKYEEKDDELNSLDDKTRAALDAWKLIYAQK